MLQEKNNNLHDLRYYAMARHTPSKQWPLNLQGGLSSGQRTCLVDPWRELPWAVFLTDSLEVTDDDDTSTTGTGSTSGVGLLWDDTSAFAFVDHRTRGRRWHLLPCATCCFCRCCTLPRRRRGRRECHWTMRGPLFLMVRLRNSVARSGMFGKLDI